MTLIVIIKTGVKGIVEYEFIWFIYRLIFHCLHLYRIQEGIGVFPCGKSFLFS